MVEARVFRWSDGVMVDDPSAHSGTSAVSVADSWLMVDGTVAGLAHHLDRFAGNVRNRFPGLDVDGFVAAALTSLPRTGRWFPRIEAVENSSESDEPMLRLRLRLAPEPLTEVTVATASHDPRTEPLVKGPNFEALGHLRTELAVGEAIIVDGDGHIAEGAWSSIVWWADDTLHVVDASIARLPGVTEKLILDYARSVGTPVASSRIRPTELDEAEVWVLSALHGIRVATEWRSGPVLSRKPGRAELWRSEYAKSRQVMSPL